MPPGSQMSDAECDMWSEIAWHGGLAVSVARGTVWV